MYANCDNNSLNLVGVHSALQKSEVMILFRAVESVADTYGLYMFYMKSCTCRESTM